MVYSCKARFHRSLKIRARFGMDNITFDLPVVSGDTAPTLQFECVDKESNIIDLSGKTVNFYMKKMGLGDRINASSACTVTDAANGIAEYTFGASDLSAPGTYFGDVVISDTQEETCFDVIRLIVRQSNR